MQRMLLRRSGGRRRMLGAALVASLALAGVSCGSASDPEPVALLRVLMTDDWVTPPFVDAVRAFEKSHPNVRVVIDRGPISHMVENVAAKTRNGVAPDVVQAHAFAAGAQGLAEPLDDLWAATLDEDEFLPGAVEDVTWNGRLYGVPLDTNALFLLYNADHFASAGLPEPSGAMTFADFERTAKALTAADGTRRAIALPTSTWWTFGWIAANGGEVLSVEDGQVRFLFDSPEVIGAMDFLARLVRENTAFPPRAADSHSGDALALFQAGSSSVLATGSWDVAVLRRDQAGSARFKPALLPKGGGEGGSVMGGSSMFVPKGSPNRKLAFEFMVQLIEDEFALRLATEQGRLPVRPRVYEDPYFDTPALVAVLEQLKTAHPFRLEAFPEVGKVFADAVDQVLRDGKDTTTVFTEAQRQAERLVPPPRS